MPSKIVFTKEEIINKAFEIFKNEGIDNITARNLASQLKCSTAPIYSNFQNIDEIKQKVIENAFDILLAFTQKEYTNNKFLNIGVGLLIFAREYKRIYKSLFMENDSYKFFMKDFEISNLKIMKNEQSLKILNDEDLIQILNKMHIFTHGLSSFLCADMLMDTSNEYFIETLDEVGEAIIYTTMLKRGKLDEYIEICNMMRNN